ncbi:MAG TPA: efflux RND transporter periplasmic adaptor subunit [Anaeromyxobacteraceae bacterium]|nr:efflux RND transporter periplasmic adaptor subunit [Anaeromyxobacteraceae bacterium]
MASRSTRLLALVVAAVALISLGGAALMALGRSRAEGRERRARAEAADRGPKVTVVRVEEPPGVRTVVLPGDVRAFWQTTLYAKVNGYVQDLAVDRGAQVRTGQVLARIASPETDHQVAQARSTLRVRQQFAARVHALAPTHAVSAEDVDRADADLAVASAELRRLQALQEYEILRAPFDGVVTARYVDPGALLAGPGQPVLEVSSPGRVRVLVNVGQDVAPFVQLGDEARVRMDQLPGVEVRAEVRRTSGALDMRSRSMLVEAWPVEAAPALLPGSFVHVALRVRVPPLPAVPAEALVQRGARLQVATVRDGRLRFVDVEPGTNDGRVVQIRSGVTAGEVVALSPPSDLGEGAPIQAVPRGEGQPQRAARSLPAPR